MAWFLSSCAATSEVPPPNLSIFTPADISTRVLRNYRKLASFEGRARIIIELPGQGYRGTSKVYMSFPDSVFVKTEAILGIDVGALFLDDRYFAAYAPRENTLYYGEASGFDLHDFLQIEIETEELMEVFVGLDQIVPDSTYELLQDGRETILSGTTPAGTVRFWIDPGKMVVTKSEVIDHAGQTILKREFQRFAKKGGVYLPRTIKITRPVAKERLTVVYTNQKVNKKIAASKFSMKTSKNAKRVYWGDNRPRVERGQKRKETD